MSSISPSLPVMSASRTARIQFGYSDSWQRRMVSLYVCNAFSTVIIAVAKIVTSSNLQNILQIFFVLFQSLYVCGLKFKV